MDIKENVGDLIPAVTIGKDEMNLVEFPITLMSKRHDSDIKTIEFTDNVIGEDNKVIKREWILTGSDKFGLPLAYDNDVWIALLQIGKEDNFSSPIVKFSRYKLCKIMGWKMDGRTYKRIEDSLKRLLGVNIYAKNAFWDNERKDYVTLGFGIINDYSLFDPTASKESSGTSSVEINKYVFQSIKNGYIKSLDTRLYFSLKSIISKRLYRYLDKKGYGKRKFEINLFTLAYAHLGFAKDTYKYGSLIKSKLDTAHKELVKAGFLKSAEYMETADGSSEKVVYCFGKKDESIENKFIETAESQEIIDLSDDSSAADTDEKLLKVLIEYGVTEMIARQLIKDYPIQKIESQVKTLPFRKAKDQAAVLVRSIQEDWSPPAGYQAHIKKEKSEMVTREHQQKEEIEKTEHRGKIEEYIASLSRDELAFLTREAKELAQEEGRVLFKGKELPQYYVKAYLHGLVEKRLGL